MKGKKGKETSINKKRKRIGKCTLKEKEKDGLKMRTKRTGRPRINMW